MRQTNTPGLPPLPRLTRQDLLRQEPALAQAVGAFLAFDSHDLHFPRTAQEQPLPLPDEGRLLLPLWQAGEFLGIFVASGVAPQTFALPLPLFSAVAAAALDRLALHKAARSDALTGLLNRQAFLDVLVREVERTENCLRPDAAACLDPGLAAFSARFGLVLLKLDRFQSLGEAHGYLFAESILQAAAGVVASLCPEPAAACRLTEDAFAVLWPDASPAACLKLAGKLRAAVADLRLLVPVSGVAVRPTASLGVAAYPADLSGAELRRPAAERARILLRKARKAAAVAMEQGRNRAFAFGRILEDGGLVLETLPMGRLVVSLGRMADAREGMRFLVLGRPASAPRAEARPESCKAEILLTQVQEDASFAEVLHLLDPSWTVAPGDRLLRADDAGAFAGEAPGHESPRRDMLTGLFPHGDFQTAVVRAMRGTERFVLALLRVGLPPEPVEALQAADAAVRAVAGLCREMLPGGAGLLAGRWGLAGLGIFLPDVSAQAARDAFMDLCRHAAETHGLHLAAGLAAHPWLAFAKADALENCRKALDHALLLPAEGQVAVCDSLSLTVSADRHFGRGDIYAAMEEYKLARLADDANLLAANSLGICHARLGRLEQALGLFRLVAQAEPGNLMAHYNVGTVCLRLGDAQAARQAFGRCLELDASHVFSLVRLGQLDEEAGDPVAARARYETAAAARAWEAGSAAALRQLARLDLQEGRLDAAREALHQVLVVNPYDAQALALMAGIYLDTDQEPEIAESMARQSVALRPDRPDHWQLLARALEAGGKMEEARRAREGR